MSITTKKHDEVTPEQLAACERNVTPKLHTVYYKVASSHNGEPETEDVFYTVTWQRRWYLPTCNCMAGIDGKMCWHIRAAMINEQFHQMEQRALAAMIEADPEYQQERREVELAWSQEAVEEGRRQRRAVVSHEDEYSQEADARERAAVKRHGSKAYERGEMHYDEQGRLLGCW